MFIWRRGSQKPAEAGEYLVLVNHKNSIDIEFDIAEFIPAQMQWRTHTYIGSVIWWTKLPKKEQFKEEHIKERLVDIS